MNPTTVTCDQACTVTLVVSADFPPFNLTEADGAQIAAAILAVWAVGWAFRALVQALRETGGNSINHESE